MNGMENILNGSSQKTKQETCFQLLVWQQRQQLSLQKNGRQNAQIKRREQMLMDYPGLIMKFTLLVQAGLTAKKSVPRK